MLTKKEMYIKGTTAVQWAFLNADPIPFVFFVGRLNEAPVKGYGKDVGTKTTLRITYPEGAIQKPENYEKYSLFVFSAFKPLDFKWLRHMVFKEKLVRR